MFDDQKQEVRMTRGGIVIKGAGKPITLTDTPEVRMESTLKVTGEVMDRCDSGGKTMAAMRQTYDSHTHLGDSGGTTGTPNQGM